MLLWLWRSGKNRGDNFCYFCCVDFNFWFVSDRARMTSMTAIDEMTNVRAVASHAVEPRLPCLGTRKKKIPGKSGRAHSNFDFAKRDRHFGHEKRCEGTRTAHQEDPRLCVIVVIQCSNDDAMQLFSIFARDSHNLAGRFASSAAPPHSVYLPFASFVLSTFFLSCQLRLFVCISAAAFLRSLAGCGGSCSFLSC